MQYRKMKDGTEVSLLGYGCMRFTRKGNGIDFEKAEREIMAAYKGGVNYYDTAYIYPGSEALIGEIFEKNGIRKDIKIATKLPHYMIKSLEGVEKTFAEELKRLRTDYVDYYLMHMLTDVGTWNKLVELGVKDWLEEKKKAGVIKNIGFSYHGKTKEFIELIDAYDWDFCQIQYNYLDEFSQAGVDGLKHAASKGIPVIIMEGLRGGKLVQGLPINAKKRIEEEYQPFGKKLDSYESGAAQLAFKWLYNQPEITVVLSGMNSMQQVEENLISADGGAPGCLNEKETELIEYIKEEIGRTVKVGCTGCSYCMPCPRGVDIPIAFRCYNEFYTEEKAKARQEYMQCTTFRPTATSASLCVQCGKCEQHCPQGIHIREELKNAVKTLETPMYKGARWAIKTFKLWG